ncbi:MAG TPA: N-acetyltransferase [Candidatus Acidoferrum sp.]|nr:N-acetyltransferase [Candidatus Acidoferrum sp.]
MLDPRSQAKRNNHIDPNMNIRAATSGDSDGIWKILEPVIRGADTYTLPPDLTREEALAYWNSPGHEVFVAEENGEILGTYYLRANQKGGGAHVANCGYMTAPWASGRGIARAMCQHSLELARERGFCAMQFNFVVSSNERAVRLWQSMGFEIVGRLPGAFMHPALGAVDALVMHRHL